MRLWEYLFQFKSVHPLLRDWVNKVFTIRLGNLYLAWGFYIHVTHIRYTSDYINIFMYYFFSTFGGKYNFFDCWVCVIVSPVWSTSITALLIRVWKLFYFSEYFITKCGFITTLVKYFCTKFICYAVIIFFIFQIHTILKLQLCEWTNVFIEKKRNMHENFCLEIILNELYCVYLKRIN